MRLVIGFPLSDLAAWLFRALELLLIVLVVLYLYHALQEVILVLRNYNFKRAPHCSPKSCGLYYFDNHGRHVACLNPFGRRVFPKLHQGGDQLGCRWSIERSDDNAENGTMRNYLEEWITSYETFRIFPTIWNIILLVLTLVLLALGTGDLESPKPTDFILLP